MNKKIITSLAVIAMVAGVALGVTGAYFSDTETSSGNSIQAGTLNLQYDLIDVSDGGYTVDLDDPSGWEDGDQNSSFALSDVKPCDEGTISYQAKILGNPGYLRLTMDPTMDEEHGLEEPEAEVDNTADSSDNFDGEMLDNIKFKVKKGDAGWGSVDWFTFNSGASKTIDLGEFDNAGEEIYIKFQVPCETGNEIQGDELAMDLKFEATQKRNQNNPYALSACDAIVSNGSSIQTAINEADSGDTVCVEAGTYNEKITIDDPLTLLGATADDVKTDFTLPATLGNYNDAVQSIIRAPAPYGDSDKKDNPNAVTITSSNVVLKGFVIEALDRDYSHGNNYNNLVELRPTADTMTGITIENNVIGPNTDTSSKSNGRHGVRLTASGKTISATITGNKIHGTYGNGNNVFIWGTAYGTTGLPSDGGPGPADLSGTVIENNDILNSARSGIELSGAQSGLTIDNNTIHDNGAGHEEEDVNLKYGNGIAFVRDYADVKESESGLGADAGYVDGVTVTDNEMYNNDKNGIYMGPMNENHTITGNDIYDNGNSARGNGSNFGPGDGLRIDLTGAYYLGWSNTQQLGSTLNIAANNNNIEDNKGYGAQVKGIPTNSFELDATNNWWGTDVENEVADMVSNYVDYDPYAGSQF